LQFFGGLQAALFFASAQDKICTHFRKGVGHLASEPDRTPGDYGYTPAEIEKLFDSHEQNLARVSGILACPDRRRSALYDPGAAAICKVDLRAKT